MASPRDRAVDHLVRRELSLAAAETLLLKAELALFADDLGGFTKSLRRLADPRCAWLVDVAIAHRLRRQIELTRALGWSAERTANAARRSWPDEPGRVAFLLDALAAHDRPPSGAGPLDRQPDQPDRAARLDTLVTAAFVDLWLTALSTYDPSEVADDHIVGVRDALAS